MEAAAAAMKAFAKVAEQKGEVAQKQMLGRLYLAKGVPAEALKLSTEAIAASKVVCEKTAETAIVLAALPADVLAKPDTAEAMKLLTTLTAGAGEMKSADAMKTAKQVLAVLRELGSQSAEASAMNMVASSYIMNGAPKDAIQVATDAAALLGDASAKIPMFATIVSASYMRRDADEVIRIGKQIAKIYGDAKNKKAQGDAMGTVATGYLLNEEPVMAMKVAEEALALLKDAGDKNGQASVMCTMYNINLLSGKSVAAMKVAQDVLKIVGSDKKAKASATLMVADANVPSKDSLEAATQAVTLFKDLGDKLGEASALLSVSNVSLAQAQIDEAMTAAKSAAAAFKAQDCAAGEAVALTALAYALMTKEEGEPAEKAAREALGIFRDLEDSIGEGYAMTLLDQTKLVGVKSSSARLLIDSNGLAHIEVSETSSLQSLEAAIGTLTMTPGIACIVLHLEGAPGSKSPPSFAVTSGTFILGLRTLGLPVICACWGKIAGPAWGLLLASDYRITASSTTFICPVWGPPEVMGDVLGHNVATQLCMTNGPMNALSMLEMGVVHQCQRGKDDTRKCASELAKRIAVAPTDAQRKTISLMTPGIEKFALTAIRGSLNPYC